MRDREADRLYRRFREQGDVAALGSLFDHAAPELLRVAAHLVRDLHAAEDLVQETFVAAIRGRASFDADRGVKPWLFGILVRQAALHHRQRARRAADETSDAHASSEIGPSRAATEREWMVELERAVQQLPSLYRDVVERHLRDGQGSTEIAHALDRAPGTVRVQIHRGLEMLRKALPAGFAASCVIDAEPARGLASIREAVLTEGARAPVLVSTAAAGSASAIGALGAWKLAASIGVLMAILGAAWIATTPETPPPTDEPSAIAASIDAPTSVLADTRSHVAPIERASVSAKSPAARVDAASTDAQSPRWMLHGDLVSDDTSKLAATEISVRALGQYHWPPETTLRAQPDADGRFEMDLSSLFTRRDRPDRPFELVVRADHVDCVPVEARIDVPPVRREPPPPDQRAWEFDVRMHLVRAHALAGRVVDESGRGIEGVEVALLSMSDGAPDEAPIDVVRSVADGAFRLRNATPQACAVVAIAPSMRPAAQLVPTDGAKARDSILLTLTRGAHIHGRVIPRGHSLQEGVKLHVQSTARAMKTFRVGSQYLQWTGGDSFSTGVTQATSAADGTFDAVGLTPGPYRLTCTSGPTDYVLAQHPLEIVAPADDVEFVTSWSHVVFEVSSATKPIPSADIEIHRQWISNDNPARLRVRKDGTLPIFLEGGRSYRAITRATGHRPTTLEFLAPSPGDEVVHRIALERASAALVLELAAANSRFTHAGVALSELDDPDEIRAAAPGMRWWPRSPLEWPAATHDLPVRDGVVVLDDLPIGLFEVRVEPDAVFGMLDSPWFHAPLVVELEPGRRLTRRIDLMPAGRVRVELVGADGEPRQCAFGLHDSSGARIPLQFFTRLADGTRFSHIWFLGDAGQRAPAVSDPALPPGDYTLVLEPRGKPKQEHPIRIAGGEITTLEIVLRDE